MRLNKTEREALRKRVKILIPLMEKSEIVNHFQKEGYPRRTIYNTINRFQMKSHSKTTRKLVAGRLAPKVIFLRKSQVKSPKSQVMTLTFLKKQEKVKVMTLTFLKGPLENTFRRFLSAPIGYLINTLHL
jgi:hypothetical protein